MFRNIERGASTAVPKNVTYRLRKLRSKIRPEGRWLECGCADGGYTGAIITNGAQEVIGIDIEIDRLLVANSVESGEEVGHDPA